MKTLNPYLTNDIAEEELDKLLAEYAKTRDTELKERICLGSLRLLEDIVDYLYQPYLQQVISKEDLLAESSERLYEKFIDGYADKILQGVNFKFSTYVLNNIKCLISNQKRSSKKRVDFYAKSWDELDFESKNDSTTRLIDTFDNPPQFYERQEAVNEIKEMFKYFKYLEPLEQTVVKLYILEDKNQNQIAEELNTNQVRVSRALKKAKTKLVGYYNGTLEPNNGENTQPVKKTQKYVKLTNLEKAGLDREFVLEHLSYLPAQRRKVAYERFINNKPLEQIAREFSVSHSTVWQNVDIAKTTLQGYQNGTVKIPAISKHWENFNSLACAHIAKLPKYLRKVAEEHFVYNKDISQISQEFDISKSSVRQYISLSKTALEKLAEEEETN